MTRFDTWAYEDIPAMASIMAGHSLWRSYGVTEEGAARRLARLLAEGESGFVAKCGHSSMVQGFVLYNRQTFGDAGYIRLLGVAPDSTSQGLGARLLTQVETGLVRDNTYRLLLLCTEWNYRAQQFYRRHGFRLVGRLPDWIQVGTAELLFAKHLQQAVT